MIGFLGGYELWIVLGIALLLFGHRIPGMARSLGSGIVEFKKGLRDNDDERLPSQTDGRLAPPADGRLPPQSADAHRTAPPSSQRGD